jgi:hypothetical protein
MKFKVRVGKKFELSLETTDKKQVTFFNKICVGTAMFIAMGVISAAAYGAVSGDYLVFESFMDMINKTIKVILLKSHNVKS